MAKKNLKKLADDNPALAFLSNKEFVQTVQAINNSQSVHNADDIQNVHDVGVVQSIDKSNIKYCNINLRIPQEYKDFIEEARWSKKMTITQYINALIAADIDKERAGDSRED